MIWERITIIAHYLVLCEYILLSCKSSILKRNSNGHSMISIYSQGTSRLISTDSESINNSPPYLSPREQFPVSNAPIATSSATQLVAVLSGDVEGTEQTEIQIDNSCNAVPEITKTKRNNRSAVGKPQSESIKIRIRTNSTNDSNTLLPENEKQETRVTGGRATRSTRATNKTQYPIELNVDRPVEPLPASTSPQPGSASYDLYRTLAGSPSDDKDLDSPSSMLGSVGSTITTPLTTENCVIQYRSSDANTDQDTSQDSSLVAPPSETDIRLAAMLDADSYPDDEVITKQLPQNSENFDFVEKPVSEEITVPDATRRRGRPRNVNAKSVDTLNAEEKLAKPPKRIRKNANCVEKELELLHSVDVSTTIPAPNQPAVKKRKGGARVTAAIKEDTSDKLDSVRSPSRRCTRTQVTQQSIPNENIVVELKQQRILRNKPNGEMLQVKWIFIVHAIA